VYLDLNGISTVVEDENDGVIPITDHSADFLWNMHKG
jgi:hypothetical protein